MRLKKLFLIIFLFMSILFLHACTSEIDRLPNQDDQIIDSDTSKNDPVIEDNDISIICDEGLYEKNGSCVTYAETCEIGYNALFETCLDPVLSPDAPTGLVTTHTTNKNVSNAFTITNINYDPQIKEVSFDLKWDYKGFTDPSLRLIISDKITGYKAHDKSIRMDDYEPIFDERLSFNFLHNDVDYKLKLYAHYQTSPHFYTTTAILSFDFVYHSKETEFEFDVAHFEYLGQEIESILFKTEITDPFNEINSIKIVAIDYFTRESTDIYAIFDANVYRQNQLIYIPEMRISGLIPDQNYEFAIYISGDDYEDVFLYQSTLSYGV